MDCFRSDWSCFRSILKWCGNPHPAFVPDHKTRLRDHRVETSSGDCFIAKTILVWFSIDSEMVREPAPFVPHLVASEDHKSSGSPGGNKFW